MIQSNLRWFGLHHVLQIAASSFCQLVLAGSVLCRLLHVEMVNEMRKNEPKHISCSPQKGKTFHFYLTIDVLISFIMIKAFKLLCFKNCHLCFTTSKVLLYLTVYVFMFNFHVRFQNDVIAAAVLTYWCSQETLGLPILMRICTVCNTIVRALWTWQNTGNVTCLQSGWMFSHFFDLIAGNMCSQFSLERLQTTDRGSGRGEEKTHFTQMLAC